jgi:hypothetical protein
VWGLILCRPEHRRPIDTMKTDNIFSNDMYICGPPFFLIFLTVGEIIEECIIPDIRDLTLIKWKWNTEFIGLTRDGEILETSTDKLDDLIVSIIRGDKVWISLIELEKSILIL